MFRGTAIRAAASGAPHAAALQTFLQRGTRSPVVRPLTKAGIVALVANMWLKSGGCDILERVASFPNPSGSAGTFTPRGTIDTRNAFFQELGTNGRSCDSCHRPENGWSVTPQALRERFEQTAGRDPIFRPHDGANGPSAKVRTLRQRRAAYSLLLTKGLIRIGLPMPDRAEFKLAAVSDPYPGTKPSWAELSLFRRPSPSTNLKFVDAIMWDGREASLRTQANTAHTGHAQGLPLTAAQRRAIVGFERMLFTAQTADRQAGPLNAGGPVRLARQRYYPGINDVTGDTRLGVPFDPTVFTLFDAWNGLIKTAPGDVRAAIARGQQLFNARPIRISGVAGLNDSPDFGRPETLIGTCSTCHNVPNVGTHSAPRFMAIGTSDASHRTGDLPLYTLRNKATGEVTKTSDPGRALVTGRWRDIGRFKVPGLRGLAARAPYFHNGMAKELGNVVDFYDSRFGLGLDNRERLDLILFLGAL